MSPVSCVEHLRRILDLVQDGGQLHSIEKTLGVVPKTRDDIRVFKKMIAGGGELMLQNERLSRASWPCDHHCGETFCRTNDVRFDRSFDVVHV
jgi:hypothetical protein